MKLSIRLLITSMNQKSKKYSIAYKFTTAPYLPVGIRPLPEGRTTFTTFRVVCVHERGLVKGNIIFIKND